MCDSKRTVPCAVKLGRVPSFGLTSKRRSSHRGYQSYDFLLRYIYNRRCLSDRTSQPFAGSGADGGSLVIAWSESEVAAKSREGAAPMVSEGALRILRAAIRLFIREGGAAFTTRGVAKEAGASLGAVQHFFPTKDQLLAAMLEQVLADYGRMYEKLTEELPFNGEARLLGAIDFLVADVWRPDTRKFFFNLYALSCHNTFAAKLVNDVYAHHRRRLAAYIGAARPNMSEEDCFDLALQIGALLDGLMIYTGPGSRSVTPRERLAEMVKKTVLKLISDSGRKSRSDA